MIQSSLRIYLVEFADLSSRVIHIKPVFKPFLDCRKQDIKQDIKQANKQVIVSLLVFQ